MASSKPARQLLARLYNDLAELQDNPYPGVAIFTDDANFRKLCLVLTPPSGPWTDLALHFDVELPDQWPAVPPKVQTSVTGIEHPNLFGSYICCDLLRPLEALQRGYTGGYTPALTLRGLFLQFLTFFSSTKVDQDYGSSVEIGDATCFRYVWEHDIQGNSLPKDFRRRTCNVDEEQLSLSQIWKNCSAQELLVPNQTIEIQQKAKVVQGHDYKVLHRFEYPNPRRTKTLALITQWKCTTCPYGSPSLPHDAATLSVILGNPIDNTRPRLQPPPICQIDGLNDDALGEIAFNLTSESVIAFSIAYPRFREIAALLHVLRRQELTCFFLRTSLKHSILGTGVALDVGARSLSSDFDWLSMEAFDEFNVRNSIEKRPFKFFLPLAFNRPHFRKAEREIWKRLGLMEVALREAEKNISKKSKRPSTRRLEPPLKPHHTVEVLYRMMNNIVVSLMKSCDDAMESSSPNHGNRSPTLLHASEKAIISYCHLFHLVIRLCERTPAILQDATSTVRSFVQHQERRLKKHTPDMGELIAVAMLVLVLPPIDKEAISWETLVGKFLEEAITRNVRWVLQKSPELEVLETGPCDYRLNTTFTASKTSLRLIMFQITFLGLFIRTYSSNISQLDDNYGFAANELPERMVGEIKTIYQVDSWPQFFQRVKFAKGAGFSKATFSQMLRDCVKMSAARQYHVPATAFRLQQLLGQRKASEKITVQ